MSDAISSVIIAASQTVAKVFVIGGIGYGSVLYPRKKPLLPRDSVGMVARFIFNTLTLPLIYCSIAVAVTIESIGDYWFVIVGAFGVIGTSYVIATIMRCFIPISNPRDFSALRVAVAFPNILSLPILIFPALCEFSVVHEGYIPHNEGEATPQVLEQECVDQSNAMIFCYFFAWMFSFWSFGNPQLMEAATRGDRMGRMATIAPYDETHLAPEPDEQSKDEGANSAKISEVRPTWDEENGERLEKHQHESSPPSGNCDCNIGRNTEEGGSVCRENHRESNRCTRLERFGHAIKQTVLSAGFIAMAVGFITACIPPLQQALFDAGAPLRFIGSAVETLGTACSPLGTMVVAASLVPPPRTPNLDDDGENGNSLSHGSIIEEHQSRLFTCFHDISKSVRTCSSAIIQLFQNGLPRPAPEMWCLHVWFCLSRLIITPAVITGLIVAMDCGGGLLAQVPNIAKLVLIVDAALPGALIVVVMLKSNEDMEDTATAVAKVYLPSYLLSILTVSGWTAVGLWITLPDEAGDTLCVNRN